MKAFIVALSDCASRSGDDPKVEVIGYSVRISLPDGRQLEIPRVRLAQLAYDLMAVGEKS